MRTVGWLLGKLVTVAIVAVLLAVAWALAYRWIDPPITVPMIRDAFAGQHVDRRWVRLDQIAPSMPRAVIGAEDSTFCSHHGFDLNAIEHAAEKNATSRKVIGGSTISQQTAKNAFLWPGRSYLRKGLEAYFTVLIEAMWGKPRIMEVYLNIADSAPAFTASKPRHSIISALARRTSAPRRLHVSPRSCRNRSNATPPRYMARSSATRARSNRRIGVVRRDAIDGCLAD